MIPCSFELLQLFQTLCRALECWIRRWLKEKAAIFRSHGSSSLRDILCLHEIYNREKQEQTGSFFLPTRARHARLRHALSSDSRVVSTFDVSWQIHFLLENLAGPIPLSITVLLAAGTFSRSCSTSVAVQSFITVHI